MTAQKSEDETKTVLFIFFIYLFVTTLSKASIFFYLFFVNI